MIPAPPSFLPASCRAAPLRRGLLLLAAAVSLAAAPAPAPETAPAPPPIRTHYESGEPVNDLLTALAVRFGIVVVQPEKINAFILQDFDLPAKPQDALDRTRKILEPQGYSFLQSVSGKSLIIRILTTAEAKKARLAESPVSFGSLPENIDVSDPARLITHMMPLNNSDMAEALRRTASEDKDVSAEIAGGTLIGTSLILLGPALKVQQAVDKVSKLDQLEAGPTIVRVLTLSNLDAQALAKSLNDSFARENTPVKAAADTRTNSLILSGPESRVLAVMVPIVSQEARAGGGLGGAGRGPVRPPQSRPAPADDPLPRLPSPDTRPGA